MKYLGIDYGAKRIGLAISDAEGKIAFPRATVPNDTRALSLVIRMSEEEKVDRIVIGDTRALTGRENPITPEAEAFKGELEKRLPVDLAWEGWSSMESSRLAGGEGHDDSSAAAIILQRYLDGLRLTA